MQLVDIHSHIYDSAFDADREQVVERALTAGVGRIILPALDSASHASMIALAERYPEHCFALMGLHPTSVNGAADYQKELAIVEKYLKNPPIKFYGIGEVGLDLYWDKTFLEQQKQVLRRQIELSLEYALPLVIHTRDAFEPMLELISEYEGTSIKGIFHSFSGSEEQYEQLKQMGDFLFGIGGVVTYKKSSTAAIVTKMELADLVLETDAPYLSPVPYRGKRNESAHIAHTAQFVADLKGVSVDEVACVTTANAERMFFPK